MNYKKIHDRIILDALTNSPIARIKRRNPNDYRLSTGTIIYVERHHVLPCSAGGDDTPSNLVEVLPEEHMMLHQIRYKMYNNVADLRAVAFMQNNSKNVHGKNKLKAYSWIRQRYSETCSGENHPMFGKKHSDETKRKLSEFRKGKFYAKDADTGEYIGLIKRNHPNVIDGKWVHVSNGIQNANKGQNQKGENNSRWTGYTDDEILKHAALLYNKLGGWNRNEWFSYCDTQHPPLPKHYNQKSRFAGFGTRGTQKFQNALMKYMNIDKIKRVRNVKNN